MRTRTQFYGGSIRTCTHSVARTAARAAARTAARTAAGAAARAGHSCGARIDPAAHSRRPRHARSGDPHRLGIEPQTANLHTQAHALTPALTRSTSSATAFPHRLHGHTQYHAVGLQHTQAAEAGVEVLRHALPSNGVLYAAKWGFKKLGYWSTLSALALPQCRALGTRPAPNAYKLCGLSPTDPSGSAWRLSLAASQDL